MLAVIPTLRFKVSANFKVLRQNPKKTETHNKLSFVNNYFFFLTNSQIKYLFLTNEKNC